MSDGVIEIARNITAELTRLRDERRTVGRKGFTALQRLDPEITAFAKDLWDDEDRAIRWFTEEVESLGWRTPWQCLAEGERNKVMKILAAIAYGVPS